MEVLDQLFLEEKEIQGLLSDLQTGQDQQLVTGLSGGSKAIFFKVIQQSLKRPVLIVSPNMLQAQRTYEDLIKMTDEDHVHLYTAEELVAADFSFASYELRAGRIETLDHMARTGSGIYITPVAGLRKLLPSKERWLSNYITVKTDEEIDVGIWLEKLVSMGYIRQDLVSAPGEFASRGGILDIYPLTMQEPVRIELFDATIDSIRTFSAEDQRSTGKLDTITLLPATEFIWSQEELLQVSRNVEQALGDSLTRIKSEELQQQLLTTIMEDIGLMKDGIVPDTMKKYASFSSEASAMLTDYFPSDGLIVFDELGRIQESVATLEAEEQEYQLAMLEDGKMLHDTKPAWKYEHVLSEIHQLRLYLSLFTRTVPGFTIKKTLAISCKPMQQFHGQMPLVKNEIERWKKENFNVFLLASSDERMKQIQEILREYDIEAVFNGSPTKEGTLSIIEGELTAGFELPFQKLAVITDTELFTGKPKRKARPPKITNAERIKSYSEIKPGDYIVHVHHGIGKYYGVVTLEVGGLQKDYLDIRYRGEDKLFVPADQIDLIQKYVASGEKEPKLHKLGGAEWTKTKRKVTAAIQDIADDLIKLYAKREAEKGFAFSEDDDLQRSFENAFPYDETADQLQSIGEIKKDMERERPMDRLLCGDVGYGKTEVAIRAAFKAVTNGKQVAFLVPTTILAQQHYETMKERFADYPVTVSLLNRFRTKKEQDETIKGLKAGTVDIVIGTHRLLSKDVIYSDLGLLVVDEEQRFGVTHKEKLKQLKNNVDVLTLTATPIPRTLHMSMVGVRDLSVIETPPANRFPVQTYVMEHNGGLVREAIEREMGRGGQVFYLYNRVEDMDRKVEEIRELVPEARIASAHGRMGEAALEAVIMSFLEGEYDVLVTTTIIETGIDIPNVNTLIVHDADRMGLSQLYQLRGRVGRSNRVAYSYMLYQRDKVLTEVAENRLQAIKEFTELGSGFKIAMRDLSIRGAGNLLGSQQHGFIDSVGFDLYSQLLQEAIEERQTGVAKEEKTDVEISLPINAYLPETYIRDGYQKIQMYKRVKAIENDEDYVELVDEMIDRFGDMPLEADLLLRVGRMKAWGRTAGVESIKKQQNMVEIRLTVEGTARADGAKLMEHSLKFGHAVGLTLENGQIIVTVNEKKSNQFTEFDMIEDMVHTMQETAKED
ncbi:MULTISPECIES: transcription-repair coupling factor [unclassified Sporosarcina]|uniref:transcription-repair coupling factor n=1 Tax=unclassified Sporosarcina TaxID=2647733 RepID=UPI00203C2A9D|nr:MULTISPECIES: transcription-repair coupling factor [unclassified Sporosarcina]GKV66679.1 transcription-repair-coupling factor [Sporosarcina sp. NCCP-2331]GLB57014.1 transcription-repair-coupling factor [Sporosarcina sp. NCCP-2378]